MLWKGLCLARRRCACSRGEKAARNSEHRRCAREAGCTKLDERDYRSHYARLDVGVDGSAGAKFKAGGANALLLGDIGRCACKEVRQMGQLTMVS